jgi:hypothetical protein
MANDDNNNDNNDIVSVCLLRVKNSMKTNATYLATYRHFLNWLKSSAENDNFNLETTIVVESGPLTLTQHNVEMYYRHAVLTMVGSKTSMRRKFNALNWYLKHVENRGTVLTFSLSIEQSVENQQHYHVEHSNATYAGSDPHNGLKDLLSQEETSTIIRTIYRFRADSLDLAFSYLWGTNTAIRGGSLCKLVLCDLYLSHGFGPDELPPNNRTLSMILRKGKVHKDRHDTDRWVGVQHHVNYQKCTVFSTAMLVLTKLRFLGENLSFLHKDRNGRCGWWDIPLSEYDELQEESNAMKWVYKKCGISSCKLTHHRLQAVQYAGSRGLHPWQINTLTKHMLDKQHSCYQPECDIQTLKVMSGFPLVSTEYYVMLYVLCVFFVFIIYLNIANLYI